MIGDEECYLTGAFFKQNEFNKSETSSLSKIANGVRFSDNDDCLMEESDDGCHSPKRSLASCSMKDRRKSVLLIDSLVKMLAPRHKCNLSEMVAIDLFKWRNRLDEKDSDEEDSGSSCFALFTFVSIHILTFFQTYRITFRGFSHQRTTETMSSTTRRMFTNLYC